MDLLKNNLSEPLSIPELAKKVGYSSSRLRMIFSKATGKGVLPHLLELRIDKAKKLLQDTRLSITEIALESGFRSYKSFHQRFIKRIGCSPGLYRETQGNMAQPIVPGSNRKKDHPDRLYYDSLSGSEPSSLFKPSRGVWEQRTGHMAGGDSGDNSLQFCEPLPENFELRFEVCLFRRKGLLSREIYFGLYDAQFRTQHCAFALGRNGGSASHLSIRDATVFENSRIAPRQEIWHKIRVELDDDTVILWMDNEEVLRHRDPFPPPYAERSHLAFSILNGEIGIREFEVFDKGFLPLVKSVRQGDLLYNGGFFSSARDFYMRLLGSKNSTADTMELRYKIGQCFHREGHYLQARAWMEKVIEIPETALWKDNALSALLEMDLLGDRLESFEQSFRLAWQKQYQRQSIKLIIDRACVDFRHRGFFEKAFFLRNLLFSVGEQNCYSGISAQSELAEILMQMRDFQNSERHFLSVIENPLTHKSAQTQVLFSFCNNLGMQGKVKEWSRVLERLEPLAASSPYDKGRLVAHWAIFDRAQGKFGSAIARLRNLMDKHDQFPFWSVYACLVGAQILNCHDKGEEARAWLARAEQWDPNFPYLLKGIKSAVYYPIDLVTGDYERAAQHLIEDSMIHKGFGRDAEEEVKAGIILSISGQIDRAKSLWKRTAEFYPQSRINFFGNFADGLASGKLDGADAMPYPAERRSEIFYLLGLLCESRGEKTRAQDFFQKSVREDLLRNWPAILAANKTAPS